MPILTSKHGQVRAEGDTYVALKNAGWQEVTAPKEVTPAEPETEPETETEAKPKSTTTQKRTRNRTTNKPTQD